MSTHGRGWYRSIVLVRMVGRWRGRSGPLATEAEWVTVGPRRGCGAGLVRVLLRGWWPGVLLLVADRWEVRW